MNEEETAPPPPGNAGSSRPSAGVAPEIARRVGSILDAVEREATRLREEAQAEAGRYLEQSRLRADALVEERRRRIAELSDDLIVKSEAVVGRLDDAAPVRQGFENLVRALADAADRLSKERGDTTRDLRPPPFHGSADVGAPGPPPVAYPPPPPPVPAPPPYPAEPSPPPLPPQPSEPSYRAQPPYPAEPSYPSGGYGYASAPPQPVPADQGGWEQNDPHAVAAQMASAGATRRATREHLQQTFGRSFYTGVLDEVFGAGSGDEARAARTTDPH